MRRGQEEAPIEILIAVTILTFVLVVAFFTFQNTCATQYEQKVHASVTLFANTLESVYASPAGASLPAQLDFSPSGSGCTGSIADVRILKLGQSNCQRATGLNSECYGVVVTTASYSSGTSGTVTKRQVSLVEALRIPTGSIGINYERSDVCVADFQNGNTCPAANPSCQTNTHYDIAQLDELPAVEDSGSNACAGWSLKLYSLQVTRQPGAITIKEA